MWGWGFFPARAAGAVELQLFTLEESSVRVSEFPFGKKYVIALVSETQDLTQQLPITLNVRHARVIATDRIPNDPAKYCKDIHVCALPGPIISPKGSQTAIEITALGTNGETLATFSQGTLPNDQSKEKAKATSSAPELDTKITNLRSNPARSPIQDPIALSLLGIAIVSGMGIVITSRKKE